MASQYPTGSIISIGNTVLSTVPPGYLLCDGRPVSRSLYFRLFQVIGTTYGAGDGVSSFNLPNLQRQFNKGVSVSVMQSSAGTSVPSKTNFLGASFSYNLGISVAQSEYTNPTGISTTNLIPFNGQSSGGGDHTHGYNFNLDNADFGAGCKNDSKDRLNPPNKNAQQNKIYGGGDADLNTVVSYEWYKYHSTDGIDWDAPNQHGHAKSSGQFTHTCKDTFVQQNSKTKCNPTADETAPNDYVGNKKCTSSQIIINSSGSGGGGKSIDGFFNGDHKHAVLRYFQLQQGNKLSIDDPNAPNNTFVETAGEDCFDKFWASERITTIVGEHNHGGSLSVVGQTGIDHNLLVSHNFQVRSVTSFIAVAPGYEGAGTRNESGDTYPKAIALGWAIKY